MKFIEKSFDNIRNQHSGLYKGALAVFAVVIIIWLYPTEISFNYEFYQGSPWQNEDLLAPFDFAILKTEAELTEEKEEIGKTIVPIYTKDNKREDRSIKLFESLWQQEKNNILIDTTDIFAGDKIRNSIVNQIHRIYSKGVLSIDNEKGKPANGEYIFLVTDDEGEDRLISDFYNLKNAMIEFENLFQSSSEINQEKLIGIVSATLDYNIVFDENKTDLLIADELSNISPFKGKVEKGTMIIQRGEIVTPAKNQELISLKDQYENKLGANMEVWWLIFGEIISLAIVFWITFQYINHFNADIIEHASGWSFILIFYVLAVVMFKIGVYDAHLNQFLMPILIFPIIIRAFFDVRLALFFT